MEIMYEFLIDIENYFFTMQNVTHKSFRPNFCSCELAPPIDVAH